MPRRTRPQAFAPTLDSWTNAELQELIAIAQGLLNARTAPTPKLEPEPNPKRLDGTALGKNGGTGHIELKMIPDKTTGKSYGPYRYLRYWGTTSQGKMGLKSIYLGKVKVDANGYPQPAESGHQSPNSSD